MLLLPSCLRASLLPFLLSTSLTSPEAWWSGLDSPAPSAPARGVHALRAPVEGRARIAGTTFVMGSSPTDMVRAVMMCRREVLRAKCDDMASRFRAEGVAHEVTLSTFEIDRTEVRVADYQRCVAAGACAAPGFAPGDRRFDQPDLPVTQVRWEDAVAYCGWTGGRLPTEAEWELAARGPNGREYPWGNVYNPHLANHGSFADDETDASDGYVGLAPVGSFPDGATPNGIVDMAGNAEEWVSDFFDQDENGFGYAASPQVSPTGPKTGVFHVIRGGSYLRGAAWIRGAARWVQMASRSAAVGFRCAADVR